MRNNQRDKCIDCGKEGCPCALADSGNCIVCGKLSGGSCNTCNWQGTCIYFLYLLNGKHRLMEPRPEKNLTIKRTTEYGENLKVFILKCTKGFAQKGLTAGAFILLRRKDSPQWFDMPAAILKSEPNSGQVHIAISKVGPKSQDLFKAQDQVTVRGVYYNGLLDMGCLEENPRETLVFAKGIGIAPFRNFLDGGLRYKKLLNNLKVFIDLDKIGMDFFMDYFGDLPAKIVNIMDFNRMEFFDLVEKAGYSNVLALTSPYFVDLIEKNMGKGVVKPNHANMCCGEGICGACTLDGGFGEKNIHNCKINYPKG